MDYNSLLNKEATRKTNHKLFHPRFSGDFLKLLAAFTMLLDHIGYMLIDPKKHALLFLVLRVLGRFSFPIFAFLIVQGFLHTKNVRNYALRLFVFALISEPLYDYAMFKTYFTFQYQNPLWTLFIGLLVITAMKQFEEKTMPTIGFTFLGCVAAFIINPDYSLYGILMIVFYYFDAYDKAGRIVCIILTNAFMGSIQLFGSLALLFTEQYKEQERKLPKYFFYFFYPLHLLILILLRKYM